MRFATALDLVEEADAGSLLLPRFQRNFVWKRPDIKEFIDSVYRGYPIGALATWESDQVLSTRLDGDFSAGRRVYLLDGQQRVTSIYGVIRGSLPGFSSADANLMDGLLFHVKDRRFAYLGTKEVREQADGLWVNVSVLFRDRGIEAERDRIQAEAQLVMDEVRDYTREMDRLVDRIHKASFPVLELNDANLTVEDVVQIFNKMNKGGKKLTPYELGFSVLSARWATVRGDFQVVVDGWKDRIDVDIDWLLRAVNGFLHANGRLSIEKATTDEVREALVKIKSAVDHVLNILSNRLGLDRPRVLKQRLPLIVMACFVAGRGGRLEDPLQRDRLLYWYILSSVFGTYLRATESRLTRDLQAVSTKGADGLDALIDALRQDRPDLQIVASDFDSAYSTSGFYTVLYMLTRVGGARDWLTGEPVRHGLLGQGSQPELHHIFPRDLLEKAKVPSKHMNNLGNIALQSSFTNKVIGNQTPVDYLAAIDQKLPGALESQWVPMERSDWQMASYDSFISSRRDKLATAANEFLSTLYLGTLPSVVLSPSADIQDSSSGVVDDWTHRKAALIQEFDQYAPGIVNHPLMGADGTVVYLDVAWPDGLQLGISQPAAYLFEQDDDVFQAANQDGFIVFTDVDSLRHYVRSIDGDVDSDPD